MKRKQYLFLFILVNSCAVVQAQTEDSTVHYQRDSAVILETDATTLFFQKNEKLPDDVFAKTTLLTKNRKTVKLSVFLKGDAMMYADYALADLDSDGKKELLVSGFTGGAHCCDDIYVFKNSGINKYQYAARLFGGHTIINPDKQFVYGLDEHFGYFFTCYACWYTDTSDAAPIELSSLTMKYNKGKFAVAPGDQELRSAINDNLGKLGEAVTAIPEDGIGQDDGERKAVAMNLAVYYYSFGKNLIETKRLFNKYYKFKDAAKVWTAFVNDLNDIKATSDF